MLFERKATRIIKEVSDAYSCCSTGNEVTTYRMHIWEGFTNTNNNKRCLESYRFLREVGCRAMAVCVVEGCFNWSERDKDVCFYKQNSIEHHKQKGRSKDVKSEEMAL